MQNLKYFIFSLLFFLIGVTSFSQESILDYFPAINIVESNNPSEGYFFIATKKISNPNGFNYFAIFDNDGTPVYMRLLDGAGASIAHQPNGHLTLIDGSEGKVFFELDSMFQVVNTFSVDGYRTDGHDFDMDENGHVLLLGVENITVDMSAIIEGGNSMATIQDKLVQEFDADGNLLYTWKAWDHYDILDTNEDSPFVDLTASTIDYIHANSLCFDSDTSFLFSARHYDEITKVDRRTGDVIWRLGGKKNDFTFINDEVRFSHQHTIRILPNGNIRLFDNGNMNTIQESSVVEYAIDEQNMTATLIIRAKHDPAIFADHAGGHQLLENGNMLVYWGVESPSFTEYNSDGSVALEMDFSEHSFSNRILKSNWKHRVFETHTDELNFGMWDGYTESPSLLNIKNNTDSTFTLSGYSTKTSYFYIEESFPMTIPAGGEKLITVVFNPVSAQTGYINDVLTLKAEYPDIFIAQQVKLKGTLEDYTSPTASISPNSSGVEVNAKIEITFTESVRFLDNVELNYQNTDNLFTLRKDNDQGELVAYDANVNTEKNTVTLSPLNPLEDNQLYYVSFGNLFEDYSDNVVTGVSQTFNTGSLTGVNLLNGDKNETIIFPNPSNGQFTLKLMQEGNYRIQIMDIHSKIVLERSCSAVNFMEFNLNAIPSGIYLVLIYKNNELLDRRRVIKN